MPEWRKLDEVADTNPESLSASTDSDYTFRYIDLGAVELGHIDWNAVRWRRFAEAPSRARRRVRHGDVLFGTVRPNLQSHGYVDKDANELVASTGFCAVRAREGEASGKYLFHVLLSHQVFRQSVSAAVGSNYPAVTDADVRGFELFIPSVQQQHFIAHILDTLDTQIRRTEEVIAKLEQVKQGLLTDLLTRGIDEDGELRPSPEEAPELYKDSPLGLIPRNWRACRLGSLIKDAYRYPSYYGIDYVNDGVPEVRGELIRPDGSFTIDAQVYRHVSEDTAARFSRVRLQSGDLVMSVRGTLGKIALVDRWLEGAVITANLLRIRPDATAAAPDWLSEMLRHDDFQEKIDVASSSTTIKTIQVPELLSLFLHVPPLEEQAKIMRRIAVLTERIAAERTYASTLVLTRRGLMDDLLTGRVRVTPLLEEAEQAAG